MKHQILSLCAVLSVCPALAAQFKDQTIDDKIGIGYGLAVADVNGDKKKDVLLVDAAEVAWYENPTWQKHVIAGKLTERDHVCIAAEDIDGDGKAEIAVGAQWNPGDTVNSGAVFYLVPPADRAQKWKAVQLPHEPTVHRMWWVRGGAGKHSLVVAPLHGRGNKNGAGEGVKLLEYLVPASPDGEWKTRLIDNSMHMTHNLDLVQWDADAAEEILFCGKEGILLLDKAGDSWKKTRLAGGQEGFAGAGEVRLGKSAMTGREARAQLEGRPTEANRFIATIEPMHGTNVAIYTSAGGDTWKRRVIDSSLADGHAVGVGDFFQKGQDQVIVGWRGKNADGKVGIKLFQMIGDKWESSWVDDNGMACEDLKVADLNGDSWPDIVAAGRATKNVKIYWNQGKK